MSSSKRIKRFGMKEQLRRFKEKRTRDMLAVSIWNHNGGGNHGDQRKAQSRNECRKWKQLRHNERDET